MKVRANASYLYYPTLLDSIDGRTKLKPGDKVKVVNLQGCPPCNTMGHAHVEKDGEFAGLVCTNSLHKNTAETRRLIAERLNELAAGKRIVAEAR